MKQKHFPNLRNIIYFAGFCIILAGSAWSVFSQPTLALAAQTVSCAQAGTCDVNTCEGVLFCRRGNWTCTCPAGQNATCIKQCKNGDPSALCTQVVPACDSSTPRGTTCLYDYNGAQDCYCNGTFFQRAPGTPMLNTCPVSCGNGVREGSEQCDAGASNGVCPSGCNSTCHLNSCSPTNFTVTVNKAGSGFGTVTSTPGGINCNGSCNTANGSFIGGTTVILHGIANGGSTFVGWSGGGCAGTSDCSVSSASTVTATFNSSVPSHYSCDSGGSGTCLFDPSGPFTEGTCGNTCTATPLAMNCLTGTVGVAPGQTANFAIGFGGNPGTVTLTTDPAYLPPGTSSPPNSGTAPGSAWVQVFTSAATPPGDYTIVVDGAGPSGSSGATSCGLSVDQSYGPNGTLLARDPADGLYKHSVTLGAGITVTTLKWTSSGAVSCSIDHGVGGANPVAGGTVSSGTISSNTTFTLTCVKNPATPGTDSATVNLSGQTGPFTLTLNKAGSGTGTVTSSPAGINCNAACASANASYSGNTSVIMTATPTAGAIFTGWSGGGCATTSPCTVLMDYSKLVTANFSPGCQGAAFISSNSSVSPSTVSGGGAYTATCDYGAVTNGINVTVGSGSCVFSSWSGTQARFSCTAGAGAGSFSNNCTMTQQSPDFYCAQSNAINSLTVSGAPASVGSSDKDVTFVNNIANPAQSGQGACSGTASGGIVYGTDLISAVKGLKVGDVLTFKLNICNTGSTAASSVKAADTLSTYFKFKNVASATFSAGCSLGSNVTNIVGTTQARFNFGPSIPAQVAGVPGVCSVTYQAEVVAPVGVASGHIFRVQNCAVITGTGLTTVTTCTPPWIAGVGSTPQRSEAAP